MVGIRQALGFEFGVSELVGGMGGGETELSLLFFGFEC